MSKKTLFIAVIVGLFGFIFNAVAQQNTKETTFSTPNKPIVVTSAHPYFTLKLQANPTTGYFWYLTTYNHFLIAPMNEKFQLPNKKLVGAPGIEEWQFHLTEAAFQVPHLLKIQLVYARPWITQGEEKMEFTIITRK